MAKPEKNGHLTISVESGTVIKVLALVVASLFLIGFLREIAQPLFLIFISFFLALGLNPAVSTIARRLKNQNRVVATGLAYLIVVTFLAAFAALVVPPLVKQTSDFIQEVPSTIQEFRSEDSPVNDIIERYDLERQVDQITTEFRDRFGDIGGPILSTASALISAVAGTIIVLVLTFMMLVEGPQWLNRFWAAQPASKRAHRKEIALKMYRVVTNYVNGQVFIAVLGGVFAGIAIFILSKIFDAPVNAVALGGIAGLFALLPLVGTTLGAVIVVLACLLVSLPLAIAVAIYFIVYQQIENVTIQPYVQSRGGHLTPLVVLIAALLGVGLGGFLGAVIAIPVAGCLKILVEDYFKHRADNKVS